MRWRRGQQSGYVEDRRGRSVGGIAAGGGGIVAIVILLIVLLGGGGGGGSGVPDLDEILGQLERDRRAVVKTSSKEPAARPTTSSRTSCGR